MKLNFKIDKKYLIAYTLSFLIEEDNAFSSKKYYKDIMAFRNRALIRNFDRSKEFKKILNQTEKYLEFCKKQWRKNYDMTSEIIKELTGLKLNKNFTVYITHPSQRNGRYLGNNQITWGNSEKWPNYTTVYLWHEILHSYFLNSDLVESIIELIADNEIRCRLNGCKYPPFEGRKRLIATKKKLLPHWKKYLKSGKRDIKKFHREMSKKILFKK